MSNCQPDQTKAENYLSRFICMGMTLPSSTLPMATNQSRLPAPPSLDATLSQLPAEDLSQSPSQLIIQASGLCTVISLVTHLQDSTCRSSKTRPRQTSFGPRVSLLLLILRASFVPPGRLGVRPSRLHAMRLIQESDPLILST